MKRLISTSMLVAIGVCGAIATASQPAQAAYSRCESNPRNYCFRLGDRGSQIYNLIEDLRSAGYYNLRNDSYYGPVTQRAIKKFQRDRGMYPDGIAGPQTRKLLHEFAQDDC